MKNIDLITAWGRVLRGKKPFLSIEITRECPLSCPGCYAYAPEHLGNAGSLRQLRDFKGDALVAGVRDLVRRFQPMHVSIVGGEPLVRHRELEVLLPEFKRLGIEVLLVTSAFRPIPSSWKDLSNLYLAISIDGLPPEHNRRRTPATYARILHNVEGHRYFVHCTLTKEIAQRPDHLTKFTRFWSERQGVRRIWFSLYTPQEGEQGKERLTSQDRANVLTTLSRLRRDFPLIEMPDRILDGFLHPPPSPQECIFAQTTTCISADLATPIVPCQFGGHPVCGECGCMAAAGLASFAKYRLAGSLQIGQIFSFSKRIGDWWATVGL